MAMKIAAADREVPGNTPATTCARPTSTATFQVTSSRSGRRAVRASTRIIQIPPMISAHATGVTVSGSSHPASRTGRPTIAVTRNAVPSLST